MSDKAQLIEMVRAQLRFARWSLSRPEMYEILNEIGDKELIEQVHNVAKSAGEVEAYIDERQEIHAKKASS